MSRFVPFRVSRGYAPVELPRSRRLPEHDAFEALLTSLGITDLVTMHRPRAAQQFFEALPAEQHSVVREAAIRMVTRVNVEYSLFLAELLGMRFDRERESASLEKLFRRLLNAFSPSAIGLLIGEAMYFPAQGFLRRLDNQKPATPTGGAAA